MTAQTDGGATGLPSRAFAGLRAWLKRLDRSPRGLVTTPLALVAPRDDRALWAYYLRAMSHHGMRNSGYSGALAVILALAFGLATAVGNPRFAWFVLTMAGHVLFCGVAVMPAFFMRRLVTTRVAHDILLTPVRSCDFVDVFDRHFLAALLLGEPLAVVSLAMWTVGSRAWVEFPGAHFVVYLALLHLAFFALIWAILWFSLLVGWTLLVPLSLVLTVPFFGLLFTVILWPSLASGEGLYFAAWTIVVTGLAGLGLRALCHRFLMDRLRWQSGY